MYLYKPVECKRLCEYTKCSDVICVITQDSTITDCFALQQLIAYLNPHCQDCTHLEIDKNFKLDCEVHNCPNYINSGFDKD